MQPYFRFITAAGACAALYSLYKLPLATFDLRFLVIAACTLTLGARVSIQIPRVSGFISVSDTFIFLSMLLFGGEAAVLLAVLDGLCTSLRLTRKRTTILFNAGAMAVSTFATATILRLLFGDVVALNAGSYTPAFLLALCVMSLVQYAGNSGSVALASALRKGEPFWRTWRENYLWTSLTYLTGASAAGLVAELIGLIGFYALVCTLPFIAILYFTYLTYTKQVEASSAQAEQAERHVEELSHYIAEQERLRQQFSQLEKMSALGELASGVAHDFNNTLAGILGRAQLMLRTSDPEKIRKGLQIIIKAAEDGAKTVKRIQDFARQRRDHDFAPVAVEQLLLDVSEMTRPRWKEGAEANDVLIRLDLQVRSKALVMGDGSELREVLVNMVFNALDAMPGGGTLTLATDETDGEVVISVRDTGGGMTPEVRSRIFDPFFTTKGKAGSGLGLAVSYGIIHRHGGTIEVESEVDRGTAFRIKLPQAQAAAEASDAVADDASSQPPAAGAGSGARILVVDDEAHVRELLADILRGEGCEPVLAASGGEALALFAADHFDGVFTDVGMPGMSGWELARAVREQAPQVPIAVITGWGEAVGSEEQRSARVDWIVTKPFTIERVAEIAHDISRRMAEGGHGGAPVGVVARAGAEGAALCAAV